jgi:CheY-like chemotaxis protein
MENENYIKPVKILLVEDNPGDVLLTQEALEECKMINMLFVAEDGEKAIQFLYKKDGYEEMPRPDLIILDLNLPKIHGTEVLKIIKSDTNLRAIPVVILTTSKAEEDVLKSYDLHANCYITKPLDMYRFIDVVKSIESFWMGIVYLPTKNNIKE